MLIKILFGKKEGSEIDKHHRINVKVEASLNKMRLPK